jgi:hypothetical protein
MMACTDNDGKMGAAFARGCGPPIEFVPLWSDTRFDKWPVVTYLFN